MDFQDIAQNLQYMFCMFRIVSEIFKICLVNCVHEFHDNDCSLSIDTYYNITPCYF